MGYSPASPRRPSFHTQVGVSEFPFALCSSQLGFSTRSTRLAPIVYGTGSPIPVRLGHLPSSTLHVLLYMAPTRSVPCHSPQSLMVWNLARQFLVRKFTGPSTHPLAWRMDTRMVASTPRQTSLLLPLSAWMDMPTWRVRRAGKESTRQRLSVCYLMLIFPHHAPPSSLTIRGCQRF